MVFKWALVAFGIAAVALFILGKALTFLYPPRPGRTRPLFFNTHKGIIFQCFIV